MEDTTEYGKKSMGQWILIYLLIGLVVYGAVYYYMMGKTETSGYGSQASPSLVPVATTESSMMTVTYVTDSDGMSLYTFDEDADGVSNCYGTCATNWPPYLVGDSTVEGLGTVTRKDGSKQYAKDGMPLYYYKDDVKG
jgi:predicted lipoprotein with Yx(FWY)xxD motif